MKKKILLVEDEAIIAMATAKTLEKHGFDVVTVHNGKKAIAKVDEDLSLSLILMDIDLGRGISGTEAAEKILQAHDLPIAFLSSHTEPEVVEKTEGITSYGYILKNSKETVLLASIKMAFRLYDAHIELKRQKKDLNSTLIKYEQTAEELAHKNEELDRYFSSSLDLLCIANTDGEFVRLNPEWEKVLGYSVAELEGRSLMDFVHPDDKQKTLSAISELENQEEIFNLENRYLCKDGSYRFIEWRSKPIGSKIYAAARDITVRKKREQELRESEEKFRTLVNQSIDMFVLHDLHGRIVDVNERGPQYTGYSREELLSMSIPDLDPDYYGRENGGQFWDAIELDQPYHFEARLKRKDHSIFSAEIVLTKVSIAGSTYIMTLSRDITERKRAENETRAREENLRTTLDSIGDAVISTDIEGSIVRMNSVAETLCGWGVDEAKGESLQKVFHIVHSDTREEAENPVAKVLETASIIGLANHTVLIAKDGTEYQIADSAAPIRDDGGHTTGVVLIFRDVTEEYKNNRQIKELKELLDAVFLSIQDGISVLNSDLSVKYVNPVMEKWYAANLPLIGRTCYSAYHNRTTPCTPCPSLRCIKTGKTESNIVKVETELDSPVQWVELFSYPLIDRATGEATGVVEFVRDISERKRAEQRLAESEARWKFALEGAAAGVWDWNAKTDSVFFSRQWKQMLGYEMEEVDDTLEGWKSRIHPEDRDRCLAVLEEHLSGSNPFYKSEHRMRCKNGEYMWVFDKGKVIQWSPDGTPLRVIGTISDITELKQSEEALRQSEERFSLAMEATKDGIWDWDIAADDIYCSPGLTSMLGYDSTKVIAHVADWLDLIHPEDKQRAYQANMDCLNNLRDSFEVEYRLKTEDGSWKWVLARGRAVTRDGTGKAVRMIGTHQDVTERKRAEEEIERQLAEKETLLQEVHHRMKNNIAQVEGLLSLQADSAVGAEAKSALQEAVSRVRSTRSLYEKLLIGSSYEVVSMKEYLENLIDSLVEVFTVRPGVAMEKSMVDFSLGPKKAISVGFILNELLTNVFKYAFEGRAGGRVSVRLEKIDGRVTLTVEDNGVGVDERTAANTTSGFGLSLVTMLAEQLGGTFTIKNDNGTKNVVTFEV